MRSVLAMLVAVLAVAGTTLPAAAAAGVMGGWTPIANPGSLVIQQVGRFCVLVYGLSHRRNLVLQGVEGGETEQPAGGGTNYRLVVVAADGSGTARYQCFVWGVPGSRANTWKLLDFKPLQ